MNDTFEFLVTAVLIAADTLWLRFSEPTPIEGAIIALLAFVAIGANFRMIVKALEQADE
jgi:Co/Zn/Cd efflux system component